jgi:hypothetical protein
VAKAGYSELVAEKESRLNVWRQKGRGKIRSAPQMRDSDDGVVPLDDHGLTTLRLGRPEDYASQDRTTWEQSWKSAWEVSAKRKDLQTMRALLDRCPYAEGSSEKHAHVTQLKALKSPPSMPLSATPPLPPRRPNEAWHNDWEQALRQKDVANLEHLLAACPYPDGHEQHLYQEQFQKVFREARDRQRQSLNRQMSEEGGYLELDAARMASVSKGPPPLPPRNSGMKTPSTLSRASSTSSGYGSTRDVSSPSVSRQSSLESSVSLDERYAAPQRVAAEDPELLGQKPQKMAKRKRGRLSRQGAVRLGSTHSVDSGVSMGSTPSVHTEEEPLLPQKKASSKTARTQAWLQRQVGR